MKAVVGSNVPDYRGMFLRGHGSRSHTKNNGSVTGVTGTIHSSAALGAIQGDATRRLWGWINFQSSHNETGMVDKSLFWNDWNGRRGFLVDTFDWSIGNAIFDNARVVPTAVENRPVNMAVKYIMFAGD